MGFGQLIVRRLFGAALKVLNKDVNIAELQRKHHAPGGKTLAIHIADRDAHFGFVIQDGHARSIPIPKEPSGEVWMTLHTLLRIVQGADGRGHSYSFKIAWAHDHVRVSGSKTTGWLSDTVLFGQICDQVLPRLRPLVAA